MSLVDYSDIKDEIANAPEPKILRAGVEVKARIISVRTGTSDKNDCSYFSPVFDVPTEPMVKEFSGFFWELTAENKGKLTVKQYERAKYEFGLFAKSFKVDYTRPLSWEDDLPGLEGYIIVGTTTSNEFGEQNNVKKYVAGK